MTISAQLEEICKKKISECSNEELYRALTILTNRYNRRVSTNTSTKKKLYYVCCEFLIGKLLINNLTNLGIYDEVKSILEKNGKNLAEIEELEPEPSLGNGGLGRLAACFLDSVASLKLCGDGIGLLYHFGLFRQVFKEKLQTEEVNPWINETGFLKRTDTSFRIHFKNTDVSSVLYDIDIIGDDGYTNKLHLFDIQSVDESIIKSGTEYDKKDIEKNLTLFLYPDDSDESGRYLRIYQQYFMVSNAAQLILKECEERGCNLHNLSEYAVIQINDTHPALIIPELIRLLTERGISPDEAIKIVTETCAYTNHTILAEALEKWPLEFLKNTVNHLVPIIEMLDKKVRQKYKDSSVYIIDEENRVHMAHIAIHYSFSTNGVAFLHTEILKHTELNSFYKIYPQRFNNKTNGITFRRWLTESNPELDKFIASLIGEDFRKDSSLLKKLEYFKNDENVLKRLVEIKHKNKLKLKDSIFRTQGQIIEENSVFDIQIKRLHEYKRQQLNILYLIDKYLEIKEGKIPQRPITAIFGAKAAPAYTIAKDIIHLILCMADVVKKDSEAAKHLNIVMIENYNVTWAQKIIPACDISEQISLASKEASGTGNMKLMLNGAVTLGTEDGANLEIHKLVGDENIYIFGRNSEEVIRKYKKGDYSPLEYYNSNPKIARAVDFITGKELLKTGNKESLERLKKELINKDWFMTFTDFDDYLKVKETALSDYEDSISWARKMLINIANAGYFSSDRTIKEYNEQIWKLKGEENHE